jgi:hypothetical protein
MIIDVATQVIKAIKIEMNTLKEENLFSILVYKYRLARSCIVRRLWMK